LRLTTRGRRSGEPRSVIIGYFEDGPNLVSMAMNGWGAAEPAWWLNLQARPEAVVELARGIRREVLGRAAVGGERERLWQRWRELDRKLDGYAARRPQETAVVVLEPRGGLTGGPFQAET
jgi:deazaflavin-dependent oxidoreductase (nitroreductase family)